MTNSVFTPIRRALISVSDKRGVAAFASELQELNVEILSTGGTARLLREKGVKVTEIADYTGFPEMMDGRVKTLHPKVHAGILGRRGTDDEQMIQADIPPIDLVAVNLYPFVQTVSQPGCTRDQAVENIDIGGPTLLRAAAKNHDAVTVLVNSEDYDVIIRELQAHGGVSWETRARLAAVAFSHTADYDGAISNYLTRDDDSGFAEVLNLQFHKSSSLRYGENPHQKAAFYQDPAPLPGTLPAAELVQGKALSFTNLLDLDAAARLAHEFSDPAAVVVKHTNPCGVATAPSLAKAYVKAREVDPLSAFGGIVGLNRTLDADTAGAIAETFIECVVAPKVDDDAREVLSGKKNLRLVVADFSSQSEDSRKDVRSIMGGWLVQARDRVVEGESVWSDGLEVSSGTALRVVTKRQPTDEEWAALRFAWRVCAHVKSNTIIFSHVDRIAAVGAGQMSRVDAVNVATAKAGKPLKGTVAASDAFFPFRDGLDEIAAAGATAVVQPGGSVRDEEVIAAADEHGVAMVFAGRRHFRH